MRRCGVCGGIGKKMKQADSPSAFHPTPSLTGEPLRRGKKNVGGRRKCLVLLSCPMNWLACTASVGSEVTTTGVLSTRSFRTVVPNLLASGTSFVEVNFLTNPQGLCVWDDSSTLHLLCTFSPLLLHQLHFRSSGIRSRRLRTPALGEM